MKFLVLIIALNVFNVINLLLMSEAVTISLITGVATIIAATINTVIALAMKRKVNTISTNIDGMRTNELKVTKDLGEAVGAEAGRQQKRTEDREDKIDNISLAPSLAAESPPVKVIVDQPADVNIIKDETKNKK